MAAIAAVMRMKCVRLQPAVAGKPEIVDLEEEVTNVAADSNLHVMPKSSGVQLAQLQRVVIDKAAAQGAFIKDRSYRVEFTALAVGT